MVQVREVITALIIFIATYLFLAGAELPFLKFDRPGGAVAGAVAMVVFGVLTPDQVYRDAISWDTLVLLLGMMVITSVMARASIFRWISWVALRRAHGPRALLAVLVLVAGALSALLVNDTVCLMCTPLVPASSSATSLSCCWQRIGFRNLPIPTWAGSPWRWCPPWPATSRRWPRSRT